MFGTSFKILKRVKQLSESSQLICSVSYSTFHVSFQKQVGNKIIFKFTYHCYDLKIVMMHTGWVALDWEIIEEFRLKTDNEHSFKQLSVLYIRTSSTPERMKGEFSKTDVIIFKITRRWNTAMCFTVPIPSWMQNCAWYILSYSAKRNKMVTWR